MGYSEFGGGGSVYWHVHNTGNGYGRGGSKGGNGKDPVPSPEEGGTFQIFVNGREIEGSPFEIDFKNPRQIQIYWSPTKPEQTPILAALADLERVQDKVHEEVLRKIEDDCGPTGA